MTDIAADVAANLAEVRARIAAAAAESGRDAAAVTLIAVGKVQPVERVPAAPAAGPRVFGENREQEAPGQWPAPRENQPAVELHQYASPQTTQAREAWCLFEAGQADERP